MTSGVTVKVLKDIDPRRFEALRNQLRQKSMMVMVGVPGTAKEPDGTPMTLVAAAQEFGTDTIPERSFLRAGIRENIEFFRRLNRINLIKVLRKQMSVTQALGMLGVVAVGKVKQQIQHGSFVPLSPRTIERKGSSKPLIDKGNLVQSITYEVK